MLKDAFVLDGPTAIGRTVHCAIVALHHACSKERAKFPKKVAKASIDKTLPPISWYLTRTGPMF